MKRLNLGWCGRLDDAELAHVTRLSALTSLELARTKVCRMPHASRISRRCALVLALALSITPSPQVDDLIV